MMNHPAIISLQTLTPTEANAYLDAADGDELAAALDLASDRNELASEDGETSPAPDDAEVHHAYFLLRRARGLEAPSFDAMRVQLRKRIAA